MRRFRFPLAPLSRLLGHRERQAELRAAQAALERRRAAGLLDHLSDLVARAQEDQRRLRASRPFDPGQQASYDVYFEAMRRAVGRQRHRVAEAETRVEERARELRGARLKRRVVEVYRDKRLAEHRRLGLRELSRLLDEAGTRLSTDREPRGPGPAI